MKPKLRLLPAAMLAIGILMLVTAGRSGAEELPDAAASETFFSGGEVTVVCFLGTECPLARLYAPRLARMADEFSPQGVRFLGVVSNVQDSPAKITAYREQLEIPFAVLPDPTQVIADRFRATRTPEVFLLDRSGAVRYQGRIDDQYEPGRTRAEPSEHLLRDAIEAVLAGREVAEPVTTAVGCIITRVRTSRAPVSPEKATVTFHRDVVPLLHRHCVECHRPGEIAPFALIDYEEVIGWGEMIVEVIDQQRMPPWHADPQHGEFIGARHVPAEDRETIAAWVDQGMPRGNPSSEPPLPSIETLGQPLSGPADAEFWMRDRPFQVPAEGTVDYQYFVVDPGWDTERWIRAAQVIPGSAAVVHHAIVFVRPPDDVPSNGIGWLGAYVPGQRMQALPPEYARRVPAGAKLVFQMHYTPNGRSVPDRTRVAVWFADGDEVTHEVDTVVAVDPHFEIPPGAADHQVELSLKRFPRSGVLLATAPHMHLRGKSFQLHARRGDREETLLSVPRYDFNWQHLYQFADPLPLADIDALEMTIGFDNSAANRVNPNPDVYVHWGEQTWNEMALAFLDVARPLAEPKVAPPPAEPTPESDPGRRAAIEREVDRFLQEMDADGDGYVSREEVPLPFLRHGFRRFDRNGDGRLDREEIAAAAAERL